jgi:hypothetical protein
MADDHPKLGERIARIEAAVEAYRSLEEELQHQLDRRIISTETLQDEKLHGLRAEHQAAIAASKEAVTKVEQVTDRRFENTAVQAEKREGLMGNRIDGLDQRLQAVEREGSGNLGERRGQTELKASTVAWIGALAGLGVLIVYLVQAHP